MEDQTQTQANADLGAIDELSMLKERARMLGITFSNNIGLDTLREKVRAKIEGDSEKTTSEPLEDPETPTTGPDGKPLTLRQRIYNEQMKLVRCRITNLDPKKKELPGEIFTVANEYIGTVRKYVPYGEVTDEGYHLPYCIYRNLLDRKFLNIRTIPDRANGNRIRVEQNWSQEFAIEVLPQLTPEELKKLAQAQLAAGNS